MFCCLIFIAYSPKIIYQYWEELNEDTSTLPWLNEAPFSSASVRDHTLLDDHVLDTRAKAPSFQALQQYEQLTQPSTTLFRFTNGVFPINSVTSLAMKHFSSHISLIIRPLIYLDFPSERGRDILENSFLIFCSLFRHQWNNSRRRHKFDQMKLNFH